MATEDHASRSVRSWPRAGKLEVGLNHGNFLLGHTWFVGDRSPRRRVRCGSRARPEGRRARRVHQVRDRGQAGRRRRRPARGTSRSSARSRSVHAEIAFTAAYLEIPSTYLVPGRVCRSGPSTEVDREGVRIAVADQSAYGLYLAPDDQAREAGDDEGPRLPRSRCSCPRSSRRWPASAGLLTDVQKLPGARMLDGTVHGGPARRSARRRTARLPRGSCARSSRK